MVGETLLIIIKYIMMTIIIIIIKNLAQWPGYQYSHTRPRDCTFRWDSGFPLYMLRNDKEDDDDDDDDDGEEKLASWKLFWLVDHITNDVS